MRRAGTDCTVEIVQALAYHIDWEILTASLGLDCVGGLAESGHLVVLSARWYRLWPGGVFQTRWNTLELSARFGCLVRLALLPVSCRHSYCRAIGLELGRLLRPAILKMHLVLLPILRSRESSWTECSSAC